MNNQIETNDRENIPEISHEIQRTDDKRIPSIQDIAFNIGFGIFKVLFDSRLGFIFEDDSLYTRGLNRGQSKTRLGFLSWAILFGLVAKGCIEFDKFMLSR